MGLATNSTPGSIVLGGDLTGVANAPELRVSGVVPGTYGSVYGCNIVVDSKGRLVYAEDSDWAHDLLPLIVDATTSVKGILSTCEPQLTLSSGSLSLNMWDAMSQAQYDQYLIDNPGTTRYSPKGKIQSGSGTEIVDDDGIIKIVYATNVSKGLMQPGAGLAVTGGVISLGDLQAGEFGPVQIGTNIDVDVNGVISFTTVATDTVKGIVQVGSGLSVAGGVLSWTAPSTPVASKVAKGYVEIGSNIDVTAGVISVPVATTSVKGVVQAGPGLGFTDGALTVKDATYTTKGLVSVSQHHGITVSGGVLSISIGSTSEKGIVQVGTNIDVSSGTISVATATTDVKGIVQVGTNVDVSSGTISVKTGSTSEKGIVQVGTNIDVSSGTISVATATDSVKGVASFGDGITITNGAAVVETDVLRRSVNKTTTVAQTKVSTEPGSGSSRTWSGVDGNIRYIDMSSDVLINNGTDIEVGAYYHFIVDNTSSYALTYGTQFKFKPDSQTQPIGTTSVLSCYAVDANTLYCIMQPNFV